MNRFAKQGSEGQAADAMPDIAPAIRTIAMPTDTNPAGDVFGGWLMCQMDLAAGIAASRCARGRCATVAVEAIRFEAPVKVGDEVTVWAELLGTGNTSMKFKVSVWKRARDGERSSKVTEAMFTYVALDSDGRPRPVEPAGKAAVSNSASRHNGR